METSGHQPSQSSPIPAWRCQRKGCSHRDCYGQHCSDTCPMIFWCPQCTRLWCEDCWGEVDAHQPIEVAVLGMIDHEKMLPKLTGGSKSYLPSEMTISEGSPARRFSTVQNEQGNVLRTPGAVNISSNPLGQMDDGISERLQTVSPSSPNPVDASQSLWLQAYQIHMKILEQEDKKHLLQPQGKQENLKRVPNTTGTLPNPPDQIDGDTSKRQRTEPPT